MAAVAKAQQLAKLGLGVANKAVAGVPGLISKATGAQRFGMAVARGEARRFF